MKLFLTVCAMVLACVLAVGSAYAGEIEVSEAPRVYLGDGGLEVTVVPLLPAGSGKVLIQVRSEGTVLDGLVVMHDVVNTGQDRYAFQTSLRGKKFWTLTSRMSAGKPMLAVFLPEAVTHPRRVVFHAERSKAVDTQALLAAFHAGSPELATLTSSGKAPSF